MFTGECPSGAPPWRVGDPVGHAGVAARYDARMQRPGRFEHTRYLGDKRTQLVYDVDEWDPEHGAVIDDIVAAEVGICFGPDTLAEARNRGYTLATVRSHRRYRKPRA